MSFEMNRIWHDSAIRALPLWMGVTMLNTSVLLGVLFFFRASRSQPLVELPLRQLLVVFWLATAVYLLLGKVRTRCQQLEMTLPIATRDLWWRHQTAVLFASILVLTSSLGVLGLHVWLLTRLDRLSFAIPIWPLIGPLFAALLLTLALIDGIRPELWQLRAGRRYMIWVLGSLFGVLAMLLLLHRWPWALVTICLALTITISRRTLRALPATYRLVPLEAREESHAERRRDAVGGPESTAGRDTPTASVGRWQVWSILYSVLHNAPPWKRFAPWLLYAFIAFLGFVLGGGLGRTMEVESLRLLYLPFGSYMLLAGMGLISYHLFRLDPLPVPRRVLFALLTLPSVVAFTVPFLAGSLVRITDPAPGPAINYHVQHSATPTQLDSGASGATAPEEPRVWVEVEPRFMGMTAGGRAPILTSPWGESHEAWHEPLFRGSSWLLYSPFNTAEPTSARFEALMTSRAIETIYGASIPPQEIQRRYFAVEDDRVVGLQGEGFSLLADYPAWPAPARDVDMPVYLALVMVPWLFLLAMFMRSFRATSSLRRMRSVFWIGLGLLLGPLILQVFLAVFGLFSPDAAHGFFAVVIHRLSATPLLRWITWLVSAAAIAICYRLALAQFERAELPAGPLNFTLVRYEEDA